MPIDPRSVQWDAAPSMTVPVGPRNPRLPYQVQGDVLTNAQTAAQTGRTYVQAQGDRIDNGIKGATAPDVVQKAGADALVAQQATRFNGLSVPQYTDALAQLNAANFIAKQYADLNKKFRAGPGATSGLGGLLDFLPTPTNQDFDTTANRLRAWAKQGTGTTGGENNSVAEMKMNLGAYIPSSWDFDKTNRSTLDSIRELGGKASREAVQRLGGVPDQNGNITPIPRGYQWGQNPALDRSISHMIGNVPAAARQGWMLRELAKFKAGMAARAGANPSRSNRSINFNDLP
jgi:hypothetical protein